jgi:peptidyl-dipeptidase Dcp
MDWHTLEKINGMDVDTFEAKVKKHIGLIPEIEFRYRSTNFNHIFSDDGYAAGYYSYLWSEVLDADAFEAFKQNGIFDQVTATAYRQNILEKGDSDDPMKLYIQFRGAAPDPDALLKSRGLKIK